ncbi:hypothetical protein D9611_014923 [Ephemerocybe angulata]|uniref:Uncharacterized protein n=1 Tax=Ephemerocybe angulata TaxID=980116 RepID=A0A8H5ER42_9AGAR|nr:hypothetical protein D9611_014923 [Tulosesus angulatus]
MARRRREPLLRQILSQFLPDLVHLKLARPPRVCIHGCRWTILVDPYLGRGDIARLCANYLVQNFHSKEETSSSKRLGQPKLSVFIAQMIYLAGAPYNTVIAALILLQRFRAKLPATSDGSFGFSGHMLWLGAFVIACSQDSMLHFVPEARSAAYWSEMTLYGEREVDEVYRSCGANLTGT